MKPLYLGIAVVAGILALSLGFNSIFKKDVIKQPEKATAQDTTTTMKASDLRAMLKAMETEHVTLALNATREGYDGDADFEANAKALDNNSVALAKTVGSVYGPEAEKQFLEIWRSHITFFVDYTVASKKGDQAGMAKAVQNLGGYTDAISDFFSKANPNLPREAVHQLVSTHVNHLKSSVDAYAKGDYTGAFTHQHNGVEQVGTVSDALSGAIVKQYPDKFK